jgi:hypothetical protein
MKIPLLKPRDVKKIKAPSIPQEPGAISDPIAKIPSWTKRRIEKGKWEPRNRLSREQMKELRELATSTNVLALCLKFGISREAVNRILKSKF